MYLYSENNSRWEPTMNNYKITIQYDGDKYKGWQKQSNTDNTICSKLENVLSKM